MILKRVARKFGACSHVTLPKEFKDEPVYIVSNPDLKNLEEVLAHALLYSRVYTKEHNDLAEQVRQLKSELSLRISRLEEIVAK